MPAAADPSGWLPAEDHLIIDLFVTHTPSARVASLGSIPLTVNPDDRPSRQGMVFGRQGVIPPAPCNQIANEYEFMYRDESLNRDVVAFSPRIPPEDYEPAHDYPDDRPDWTQLVELGRQLWPAPDFTHHLDESCQLPVPVR